MRHMSKPHSDCTESTNERRESIGERFLLIWLECCQQTRMSLCQAPGQQLSLLVPFFAQMQSEHACIVKVAHSLHPSLPLQMRDEATHCTFLQVQLLRQLLLRHRFPGRELHQREHL